MRLGASLGRTKGIEMTKTTTSCQCAECGTTFEAKRDHAAFCSDACRKAFNNRRMTRGAELYDLFMAVRYERGLAKVMGLWSVICRAACRSAPRGYVAANLGTGAAYGFGH